MGAPSTGCMRRLQDGHMTRSDEAVVPQYWQMMSMSPGQPNQPVGKFAGEEMAVPLMVAAVTFPRKVGVGIGNYWSRWVARRKALLPGRDLPTRDVYAHRSSRRTQP